MNRKPLWAGLAVIIVVLLVGYGVYEKKHREAVEQPAQSITIDQPAEQVAPTPPAQQESLTKKLPMEIDANKTYTATLHTSDGDITIELNKGETPKTVANFVTLAEKHFYDNTVFHRVINGFMIQGGDPQGDGTGGPGYKFDDETFTGSYTRGTVAMANAGPNTNGSQFFIMHKDYELPKNYVIFGHVTKGLDVVDTIATTPVTMSPSGEQSKPVTQITVKTVDVTAK